MRLGKTGDIPNNRLFTLFVPAREGVSDYTTCGATEDTLEATESLDVDETTIAGHEFYTGAA
jgi:hypothetical protein